MNLRGATLYIVATPIGNLEDVTHRALGVLRFADAVYAEDTRVSQKLLMRYGIDRRLHSYREAAERHQVQRTIDEILRRLQEGESVAYVSDAGTPGLSDPGSYLVQQVVAAGFPVEPIPGPSALAAILSVAGYPVQRPLFVGFLPKKKGHQTRMHAIKEGLQSGLCDAAVFYESPERIVKLLEELLEWKVPLSACVGRELTKLHEEILRGPLDEIAATLSARPSVKGEFVLLIYHQP